MTIKSKKNATKAVNQSPQDDQDNNDKKSETLDTFTPENVQVIVAENEQLKQRLMTLEILV